VSHSLPLWLWARFIHFLPRLFLQLYFKNLSAHRAFDFNISIIGIKHSMIAVRRTLNEIIERPDDMTEVLAYYINTYGKPIPNSIKKGLADSFGKFDEYQLAKYNRKNAVKLKDILCLVHPKAKDEIQNDLWKRLLEDRLETPVTWETELSLKGNTKEVWERLIDETGWDTWQ